jgi:hypothetical protein
MRQGAQYERKLAHKEMALMALNFTMPSNILLPDELFEQHRVPTPHKYTFSILVAVLAGFGSARPSAETPELALVRQLGRAFNEFGANENEGYRYMLTAYSAVRDLHGHDMSWLNFEWSGVGKWLG